MYLDKSRRRLGCCESPLDQVPAHLIVLADHPSEWVRYTISVSQLGAEAHSECGDQRSWSDSEVSSRLFGTLYKRESCHYLIVLRDVHDS
jgi:hypothetical protein